MEKFADDQSIKDLMKQTEIAPKEQLERYENRPQNREELYDRVQIWLYIKDTNRIDVILAVALTVQDRGEPLWIFFVGGSGDAKSELLRALEGLPFVRKVDQLTANTFASGRKNTADLGSELQDKDTLLLFTDLACLTSLNKDEKKKIWSQFRTLYDKEIYKDTGSGVKKKYDNCNVTLLACTTNTIKDEYHIHQQLGTRELLYDTEPDPRDNKNKMLKALHNSHKKVQMRKELKEAMQGFLIDKKLDTSIEIPEEILEFILNKCEKIRLLRASGSTDWRTGEMNSDVEAEVTTRVVQQFSLLYKALKSLDSDYPDEKYKEIIERFVRSSSQPVRYKLYEFFKKNTDWTTVYRLHEKLKNSRIAIASQCETLWNLDCLEKEIREERTGGYVTNEGGCEIVKGGRVDKVAFYKPIISRQEELP